MDFYKSKLNSDALMKSLVRLSNGEKVPVPIFNCLTLDWVEQKSKYPSVVVSDDISSAITRFNRKKIRETKEILEMLGKPDFYIVIPDSEILDDRVWPFAQSEKNRTMISMNLLNGIQYLFPNINCIFWSEYCSKYGLRNPAVYTKINYEKIKSNPILMETVAKSLSNMRTYLTKYIGEKPANTIEDYELLERTIWYFAMYMGEGQALTDSNAISINFEEGNVLKWFQTGADGNLPIISPSNDIYGYYQWRNNQPKNELLNLPEEIKDLAKKATDSDPLILYVPWGFRKTSSFGGKELSAMNIIDQYSKYLSELRIPFRILLMTTTPYWTEINGYNIETVASYYKDVRDEGESRGYEVVDWDDLRMQRLEKYYELLEFWTEDRIKSKIPIDLLEKSKKSAKYISQRTKELGKITATLIYDRERIVEAQMIREIFPLAIKFSMAPNGGVNDYFDMDLPRIFPLPDELVYPWWPERRIKQ